MKYFCLVKLVDNTRAHSTRLVADPSTSEIVVGCLVILNSTSGCGTLEIVVTFVLNSQSI